MSTEHTLQTKFNYPILLVLKREFPPDSHGGLLHMQAATASNPPSF